MGVTHQPIEQLAQLRSIPGLNVFRPCDANELLASYQYAITNQGPEAIILSKNQMETVDGKFKDTFMGGYILKAAKKEPKVTLIASGSEVALAVKVCQELSKKIDCAVVSMPSPTLFDKQSALYKAKVLGKGLKVAIEASNDNIWYKFVGEDGIFVGVNDYQGSGDGQLVYKAAGFDVKGIVRMITKKLGK